MTYFEKIPEKGIFCSKKLAQTFSLSKALKFEKNIVLTDTQNNNNKASVYLANAGENKTFILVDSLGQQENYLIKILALCNVKQFLIVADVTSADPSLKIGDLLTMENFIPLNIDFQSIPNVNKGIIDLNIQNDFHTKKYEAAFKLVDVPIKKGTVILVNDANVETSELGLKLAQTFRASAITSIGISETIYLNSLNIPTLFVGIVREVFMSRLIKAKK